MTPKSSRRNDSEAQMRKRARSMTNKEIEDVAGFYARKALNVEGR